MVRVWGGRERLEGALMRSWLRRHSRKIGEGPRHGEIKGGDESALFDV